MRKSSLLAARQPGGYPAAAGSALTQGVPPAGSQRLVLVVGDDVRRLAGRGAARAVTQFGAGGIGRRSGFRRAAGLATVAARPRRRDGWIHHVFPGMSRWMMSQVSAGATKRCYQEKPER